MGAAFFLLFMAILFFVALFFIFLCTIFIIVWNVKKRKRKEPKRRWLVIPVIFLVISVMVAFVPIGYIGFLRYTNNTSIDEIVYAESGNLLLWPRGEFEDTTNWFEMDGKKYVRFREGFSEDRFILDYSDEQLGEPLANIQYNPSNSSLFNDFMWTLLSGSTYSEQHISTIYPVENDNGFEFYYVQNSPGSANMAGWTYCAEDKLDSTKAYYADAANYDMQNIKYKYSVYTDSEQTLSKRHDTPYIRVTKEAVLTPGTLEELYRLYDSAQGLKRINIPQKYKDLDEAAIPGTPIFGYDERELYTFSKDKMAFMHTIRLILMEDQVYVNTSSDYDYISGYPLPDEMNQYIIDNFFNQ